MQKDSSGMIFDIQHFSIHDGPGIRTTVFLKGCPLKCKWCQNPESQAADMELVYDPKNCIGCRRCDELCPEDAIISDSEKIIIDRARCSKCGKCIEACASKAITATGREASVSEILKEVIKDTAFYVKSDGGMTLSGGEPLFQPEFSIELLQAARAKKLSTAVETCGHGRWEDLLGIIENTELLIFDLKHVDSKKHQSSTGQGNVLIIDNLEKAYRKFKDKLHIRIPVIPGFNDSEEDITEIGRFLRKEGIMSVELIPFHQLGSSKYTLLDRAYEYKGIEPLGRDAMDKIRTKLQTCGINVG